MTRAAVAAPAATSHDPAVVDDDRPVGGDRSRLGVEQAAGLDHDALRARGGGDSTTAIRAAQAGTRMKPPWNGQA